MRTMLKKADNRFEENSSLGYFKVPLDSEVPIIVADCVAFLRLKGTVQVGIFRVPGSDEVIQGLKAEYNSQFATKELKETNDASILNNFSPEPTVNDVASLLKLFFKDLPGYLIPETDAKDMIGVVKKYSDEENEIVSGLSRVVGNMKSPNRECLCYLVSFLREVCTLQMINQMNATNIATCFVLSIMGHGKVVSDFEVLGTGAVVLKNLIMLPVQFHMPKLSTMNKNIKFSNNPSIAATRKLLVLETVNSQDQSKRKTKKKKTIGSLISFGLRTNGEEQSSVAKDIYSEIDLPMPAVENSKNKSGKEI